MRESLINKRTQMKNELIAMIDYWGIDKKEGKLFKDEEEDIKWINNLNLNENIKKGIIMNYNMILNMSYNIEKFEELIENILKDNEDYNKIKENIKSIGTISGAYIISKIENIDRFDSSKKLTAYLGLVPRVNDSDGKGYNGHITGRTDKGLLRVIIQAAWVAVRYNKIYKEFFENVKSRRGKQKAIVAVAKKMIVNVYYVLKRSSPTANDLTIECVKED